MNRMSGHIAHDMYSSLSGIQWYLEQEKKDNESRELIYASIDKINQLIEGVDNYANLSSTVFTSTSIKQLVGKRFISKLTRKLKTRNIAFNATPIDDNRVVMDIEKIQQAINYLTLKLCSLFKKSDDYPEINLLVQTCNSNLNIHIRCNAQKKLFKHMDSNFDDLLLINKGLSLFYAKAIVIMHGGIISLKISENNHTEFVISIPIDQSLQEMDSVVGDKLQIQKKNDLPKKNITQYRDIQGEILVVDSDIDIVLQWNDLINEIFNKQAITATTPEQLLDLPIRESNISTAIVDYRYDENALTGDSIVDHLHSNGVKHIHICSTSPENDSALNLLKNKKIKSIIPKPLTEEAINYIIQPYKSGKKSNK